MNKDPHNKVLERYHLTKEEFLAIERTVLVQEHLKRYGAVRRFCYGNVLDFAAGCGYGTYMLALNPDVESATGIDIGEDAIAWAREHYGHPKVSFEVKDGKDVEGSYDTLVCLETLEHIQDTSVVPSIAKRCGITNVIVSFPDKKTTHYNPHHVHDFSLQEVADLFPGYVVYHTIRAADSTTVLLTKLPDKAPHALFRNLKDF